MKDKISVIIPTYNRAHILKDALECVLRQTYPNWECIIIDDGSTDHSERLIKEYAIIDNRFKFIKRPLSRNKGAATCRNIGLENATGDYIQFLDSDDILATNKFEIQIELLKNEDLNAIATCRYGIMKTMQGNPKILYGLASFRNFENPHNLLKTLALSFSYFPLHVFLIPKLIIEKAGMWNEHLSVNDDGEYFSRVILNSSKIKFCNNTFAVYRMGAGNRITTQIMEDEGVKSYIESWNLIERNIAKKMGINNHIYVRAAKTNMYNRLLSENSPLVTKYSSFFKDRWTNPTYFITLVINKVRTILMVSSKIFYFDLQPK
ncbi:glycosyltransferase family 2 protein [Gillisia sp. CAL575]|uniref:glycosyltransferase family 2 protein n=1 Tax=Gillisia sp. CAL575 TaxID=985255 RepID=UPI00039AAD87|nr:glycosyltransferase family 2 protein [Gillisia sp. CAL575]